MSGAPLPPGQRSALAALLSLPALGPARLRALLDRFGEPAAAWDAVRSGRLHDVPLRGAGDREQLVARWRAAAAADPPAEALARHRRAGVTVLAPGDPDWPRALTEDPEPPAALFVRGDPSLLDALSVAVVGTRRCTAAGASVARTLGADLAAAGIRVVSGLAVGIDGAAHRGALHAGGRPIGVVATGLDVVYPRRHRELWDAVATEGVLASEAALGVTVERWRFPSRNRLIAAFATVVVVVESPSRGGSLSTVDAAADRHTPVLAVPGSVLSEQSRGTNQLLFDGAGMARDAADILGELGTAAPVALGGQARLPLDAGDPFLTRVLAVLSPTATSLEAIAAAVDGSLVDVTTALARLEASGAARRSGPGYRRVVP